LKVINRVWCFVFITGYLFVGTLFLHPCFALLNKHPLIVVSKMSPTPKIIAGGTFNETLTLKNVGDERAFRVQLIMNIQWPFALLNSSTNIYVGNIHVKKSRTVTFGISIDKNADVGISSIAFSIEYEDADGEIFTQSNSFSVRVVGKPKFDIQETVLNHSQSKLFAGESIIKIFRLKNFGNEEAKMVQLSLDVAYPFALSKSSSNIFIGDLKIGENQSDSIEISVDREAVGVYSIPFTISYEDVYGEVYLKSGVFGVEVLGRTHPLIHELVMSQNASRIFAGDMCIEKFNLANVGGDEARWVHLSLEIAYPFTLPKSSSNIFIGGLGIGENKSISIEISVDKNALVGVYTIPFTISYEDVYGEVYLKSGVFGVEVLGEPQLLLGEIRVDPSSMTPGQEGLMIVRLTNVGTDVACDASMKIFGGRDIIASSFAYAAKIDSKKSESLIFPVSLDKKLNPGTYLQNITVIYRDNFNNIYHLSKLYEFNVLARTPFVPYFYMAVAFGLATLTLVGYIIFKWEPEYSQEERETKNPRRRAGAILLNSCVVVIFVFLLIPYLIHANLDNVGVVIYCNETTLESLPEDIQEICMLRGFVTPVVLLVKHLRPTYVTMVIALEKFSLGTVVEMSEYVVNWRVDWRDFNLADQNFERFAIANVGKLDPFESSIETLLLTKTGLIVHELSRINFYAGSILVVLSATLLIQGRLALWNLPAIFGCYSFQVWRLNVIANKHHLYVASEWKYFGYYFIILIPLALYLWYFELSPGGRRTAEKMRALSQALGLLRE